LEKRDIELGKARKDVDKVKEEWNKKIQKGHDKIAALEVELKEQTEEFDTMKVGTDSPNRY
jgi:hypothetical protein